MPLAVDGISSQANGGSPNKRRRKPGRPSFMLWELPVELIFQISGYLAPLDLLHLSRTSKTTRLLLLRKSVATQRLWSNSIYNAIGLPECPPDMVEPQYISFLLDQFCQECLSSRARLDLRLRVRLCKKCFDKCFQPCEELNNSDHVQCHPPFVQRGGYRCYYGPHLDLFLHQLRQPEEARRLFLVRAMAQNRKITKHVGRCESWLKAREQDEKNAATQIRIERKEAIRDRIYKMGLGEDLDLLSFEKRFAFFQHEAFSRSTPLNSASWSKIKPSLVELLSKLTEERLDEERAAAQSHNSALFVQVFNESQRLSAFVPNVATVFSIPGLQDVFEKTTLAQRWDPLFLEAMARLPSRIAEWQTSILQNLAAKLKGSAGSTNVDSVCPHDILARATSAFLCTNCRGWHLQQKRYPPTLFYPGVLFHRCLRTDVDSWATYIFTAAPLRPYHLQFIVSVPPEVTSSIRAIVSTCGLDPESATVEDMDRDDPWLRCLKCCEWDRVKTRYQRPEEERREIGSDRRLVMDWRTALAHHNQRHASEEPHFALLSEPGARIADLTRESDEAWCRTRMYCVRCRGQVQERAMDEVEVVEHLKSNTQYHATVDNPVRDIDYFQCPSARDERVGGPYVRKLLLRDRLNERFIEADTDSEAEIDDYR